MKLYNANLSPNALRVRAVAKELGIELEIVDLDFRKGENKTEAYLALNPNGKVPMLVDGDFVLWESRAINAYLASLKGAALPADAKKRAIVDQWSYWHAVHLGPAMQRVVFERVLKKMFGMGEPDETAIEPSLKELAQLLPILDANLAGQGMGRGRTEHRGFRGGEHLRLPQARAASRSTTTPHIAAWLERMEARPSWQDAVAPVVGDDEG